MSFTLSLFAILFSVGIVVLFTGLAISKYPSEGRFLNLKSFNIEAIVTNKYLRKFLNLFTAKKRGLLYEFSDYAIKTSETNISINSLFLIKIFTFIMVSIVSIMVNYTNLDIVKLNIITHSSQTINIFQDSNKESDYSYNFTLYTAILKNLDVKSFNKANDSSKMDMLLKILPSILNTSSNNDIQYTAANFLKTYEAVKSIHIVNWKIIILTIFSFFVPELFLLIKRLLLSSVYKKEVIKLENIIELLGSIDGFKTIDILEEMIKCSKAYRKHLVNCRDIFKTDKTTALQGLKIAANNQRFSKLVDVLRIYSMVDKKLAIQILWRNKNEKEQQILLTAEEDLDWIDIAAFVSISPILFLLANLLIKPMFDLAMDTFKILG